MISLDLFNAKTINNQLWYVFNIEAPNAFLTNEDAEPTSARVELDAEDAGWLPL
jgi:hypothetical protein